MFIIYLINLVQYTLKPLLKDKSQYKPDGTWKNVIIGTLAVVFVFICEYSCCWDLNNFAKYRIRFVWVCRSLLNCPQKVPALKCN